MKFGNIVWFALLGFVSANERLKLLKEQKWGEMFSRGILGKNRESIRNQPQKCENGFAVIDGEPFPCKDVDFLSYVSLEEMEITSRPHVPEGVRGSDIWGWLSPNGAEITIMCMDNGVAFIDTTDPLNPCTVATLASPRAAASWCDVKVYKDTAYIVKDTRGGDVPFNDPNVGGQVFDLLRLEEMGCPETPLRVEEDFLWTFHGSSHNLIINTETGFLYSVGGDKCKGGLMVIDLNNDRLKPEFVFCIDGDGYTHDAQCVIYDGPDARYVGREICFAFNENTLTIWDVDYKFAPAMLSRITYPSQVYTHQGWLTDDMSTLLMDDELNELCSNEEQPICDNALGDIDGETRTSTLVVNVTDLTDPEYMGKFLHQDRAIDHNLYLWGPIHKHGWGGNAPLKRIPNVDYAYMHNYCAGLRILDVSSKDPNSFTEIGYFDVAPDLDEVTFLGAWSGYLHPSGAYAVSSVDRGLFMLNATMAFDNAPLVADEENDETGIFVLVAFFASLGFAVAATVAFFAFKKRLKKNDPLEAKGEVFQATL